MIPDEFDGRVVTVIAVAAFEYNHAITAVSVPDSVTDIQGYAFYDCTNLVSVSLPAHLNSIGSFGISYCLSLTNLALPDGLTYMADQALMHCETLTNISIPRTVTSLGIQALAGCSKLLAINVDLLNPVYCSLDGVLFDKTKTMLMQYPGGKPGTYRIPDSVTNLQAGPFASCVGLTGLIVPKAIVNFGSFTCYNCANLKAVYFLGNAPSAGTGALDLTPAIVYYFPATTGWAPTFHGHPTVLWNPEISTLDSSLGIKNDQFGFNITGTSNLTIVVEACTNLANPAWTAATTNILTGAPFYFSDPQWTNYSARFYRLRSP